MDWQSRRNASVILVTNNADRGPRLQSFPDKEELLRNMMGLLGNVAEVAELRPQLMNTLFLDVFYDLLDSSSDGIEVRVFFFLILCCTNRQEKRHSVVEPEGGFFAEPP